MQKKVRQEHNFNVPRDLVHAVMVDLDPEGLEQRGGVGIKKTREGKEILRRRVQIGYTHLTDTTSLWGIRTPRSH
jgi:hypothetical protein